ncbi:outer membrane protein OmpK [Vibrio amylolyticus]|uniref:outer membrane protein OmpK n=1 Tax=Vibrio amylolyticus TaxID=2847292 RepID=UPI003550CCCD
MRKSLLALTVIAAATAVPAQAEYLYGWGDVSVNYLDWSKGTEERNGGFKNDFTFLELEGGAGFTWGELYGFADFEFQDGNPGGASSGMAMSTKGTIAVKTGLKELRFYAQTYSTENQGFHARNTVGGVSYALSGDAWFFNPFIGLHYTNTVGFADLNGGMAGWVGGYNFNLGEQKFSISNWHETEFGRKDEYLATNGETDDLSYNGALAAWWHVTSDVSTGVQYRYAHNKLGQAKTDNAIIYTVKYNF